jgi:hypothetical protein
MKYLYTHGMSAYLQQLKSNIFLFALALATAFSPVAVTNDTDELPAVACHALIKPPSGLIHYTDLQLDDLPSIQPVIINCTLSGSGAAALYIQNEWLQAPIEPADWWCVAIEPDSDDPNRTQVS